MWLIAVMIRETERIIMIKTAITLRNLISFNKISSQTNDDKIDIISSYEKISVNSNSDLTKATVNNAFSGIKRSTMPTIITIVETMGFTMTRFGEVYDKITKDDIIDFKNEILSRKKK